MKKINYFFGAIFLVIGLVYSLFGYNNTVLAGANARATLPADFSCPSVSTGKAQVVFELYKGGSSNFWCIEIAQGTKALSFQNLVSTGMFLDTWKNDDANTEYKNCVGEWQDEEAWDIKASALKVDVAPEFKLNCDITTNNSKLRYRIETDAGDAFIYSFGLYGELTEDTTNFVFTPSKTNISLVVGAKETIDIAVVSVKPGLVIDKFECLNCDGEGLKILSSSTSMISIQIDSAKIFEKKIAVGDAGSINLKVHGANSGGLREQVFATYSLPFSFTHFDCSKDKPPCNENARMCFPFGGTCYSRIDDSICNKITEANKQLCGAQGEDGVVIGSSACFWDEATKQCKTALGKALSNEYKVPEGYDISKGGYLPPCAFSGSCRNIDDIMQLLINFGIISMQIIGMWAFVFFIYGGFTMITSFGNAEKVKKGRDTLVAAIIGIVIVLSAYLLVSFMLSAFGVQDSFRVIK